VLAGNRIEIPTPELPEGTAVEVTITAPEASELTPPVPPAGQSLLDFFESLPPSERTLEEWDEFDREFRRERDAWDR